MTETISPPPPPVQPSAPVSALADDRQMAMVIYILSLVPAGITHLVGVILAYVSRPTAPDWLKTHYTLQIRTFWIGLLYFVIACVLCVILIGIPLLLAVVVWFVIRCAIGLSRLSRGEAYPAPESWLL
jgi:uncharacterized membrane protein